MLYRTNASFFRDKFGTRVQKLSIDGGFTCPNRDGRVGTGGCTFCRNEAFTPSYCREAGAISNQINEGIAFHRNRYRSAAKYLAYFQSFSNTYADLDTLHRIYSEALSHPEVIGIVVGTRPDCINDDILHLLDEFAETRYVAIELGIESCYDKTLQLVNRGHDFATTRAAISATAQHNLPICGHIILGLPGEDREMILAEADMLNSMPLTSIKMHQLQLIAGTAMAHSYATDEAFHNSVPQWTLNEYINLVCDMLERLRPDMVIERLAGEVPPRYQATPQRSFRRNDGSLMRNEDIPRLVEAELQRRGSRQGILFNAAQSRTANF